MNSSRQPLSAHNVSPTSTPRGTEVVTNVKSALTDPTNIVAFIIALQGALLAFTGQGLINLIVTNPDLALTINNWLLFIEGLLVIIARSFFGKTPVTFRG